jgi:hypothetical protein
MRFRVLVSSSFEDHVYMLVRRVVCGQGEVARGVQLGCCGQVDEWTSNIPHDSYCVYLRDR